MYERSERTASIDIAVNAANAYGVTLDYLFGIGYKNKELNDTGLYDLGFSEEAIDQLVEEEVVYYVDAVLSNPMFKKIKDILYGYYYKPLVNSYEINYISRIVADLLYNIMVGAMKDTYKLRPMTDAEIGELLEAVNHCLTDIGRRELMTGMEYHDYLDDNETIELQLERIKILLENSNDYTVTQAKEEGFREALQMVNAGIISLPCMRSPEEEQRFQQAMKVSNELEEYVKRIPLTELVKMSPKEQFERAEKMVEDDKKNNSN